MRIPRYVFTIQSLTHQYFHNILFLPSNQYQFCKKISFSLPLNILFNLHFFVKTFKSLRVLYQPHVLKEINQYYSTCQSLLLLYLKLGEGGIQDSQVFTIFPQLSLFLCWPSLGEHLFDHHLWSIFSHCYTYHYKLHFFMVYSPAAWPY